MLEFVEDDVASDFLKSCCAYKTLFECIIPVYYPNYQKFTPILLSPVSLGVFWPINKDEDVENRAEYVIPISYDHFSEMSEFFEVIFYRIL